MQADVPQLILASASTARRSVLAAAGLRFAVRPAAIDEASVKRVARSEGLDAIATALRLADAKAAWVARQEPQALVIGADQILTCDGVWYDKPEDLAAARRQLLALRDRTHELATVVVCHLGERRIWRHATLPRLTVRAFTEPFLDEYLALEGERVLGSVGAYRLEGPGAQLFATVEGDHASILGLPLLALLAFLRGAGVVMH